jgi:hypothetical protein
LKPCDLPFGQGSRCPRMGLPPDTEGDTGHQGPHLGGTEGESASGRRNPSRHLGEPPNLKREAGQPEPGCLSFLVGVSRSDATSGRPGCVALASVSFSRAKVSVSPGLTSRESHWASGPAEGGDTVLTGLGLWGPCPPVGRDTASPRRVRSGSTLSSPQTHGPSREGRPQPQPRVVG